MRFQTAIRRFFFSFPIQLLLMLVKKNPLLLAAWAILWGFITQTLSVKWGIPYLFLDPEYMGNIGFGSFLILGGAFGVFIMAFNISSYIMNGFRFPFLATLSLPFLKYIINNSIVPILFVSTYLYQFVNFQLRNEYQSNYNIIIDASGLLLGMFIIISLTTVYFFSTNKDIYKMFGISVNEHAGPVTRTRKSGIVSHGRKGKEWEVETYFSSTGKIRLVRGTEHYDPKMIESVFRQNHLNAAFIEVIVFIVIIVLGLFRDYTLFRVPAGASITMMFSMLIMLTSAFRFWLRGWAFSVLLFVFLVFNYLAQFDFMGSKNKAYGLNYNKSLVPYNLNKLKDLSTDLNYKTDMSGTIDILEKWKRKCFAAGSQKPKLIFINASGGGIRSALWTFRVLQVADSLSNGRMIRQTQLISGSSGGLIGASYFRELYWRYQQHKINSYRSNTYLVNISKDLLNPIALSFAVNDLFISLEHFHEGHFSYVKDRGYAFEQQLNENTGHILAKKISDYRLPEAEAIIPMLIINPTINNDGRSMYISPQPVSYFTDNWGTDHYYHYPNIIEGVEFRRLFAAQDADSLYFTSALRMNATFPYIMPVASLPSEPMLEVMDAGIRDNFGLNTSLSFLYTFRQWIEENTSGVIFVQIRDTRREVPIERKQTKSLLDKLTAPLGSFYGNFSKIQDYNHDQYFQYASSWFHGQMDVISFEIPNDKEKISLSWHLTTREKNYIYNAIDLPKNRQALSQLKILLERESQ